MRAKRKLFLKEYSSKLLQRFENEGVLSLNDKEPLDPKRKHVLLSTLKAVYEIQPKIFSNLSIDQKRTFIALIDALLVSDQRGSLLHLLENIVDLEEEERAELTVLLSL